MRLWDAVDKSASVVEGGVLRKLLCSGEITAAANGLFLSQKLKNMDLNEKMYYNTLTKLNVYSAGELILMQRTPSRKILCHFLTANTGHLKMPQLFPQLPP